MIKLKKIVWSAMIVILLLGTTGEINNKVSAVSSYIVNQAELYSKGELEYVYFREKSMTIQYIVYEKDGLEYPAYSLNRNLLGVDMYGNVITKVNKSVENMAVWRAITEGYPYKTPQEIGCRTEEEAYAATMFAVYGVLYPYDWSEFESIGEAGQRVISAAMAISEEAKSSDKAKIAAKVEVKKVTSNWKEDNELEGYISRTYKVETNAECESYRIKLDRVNSINGIKITDINNVEKTEFAGNEEFKILIPVAEVGVKCDPKGEIYIKATATLKTMPILYGETTGFYQDYALTTEEWEYIEGCLTDYYPANKTKIQITKKDAETGSNLLNAKFNVLDKNGKIVYADVTTNAYGMAEIKGVIPGTYFIEEAQAPNGYTQYDERIEVKLRYNETCTINVNNYEKPESEDKDIEEESQISVTGKKEEKLPVTGF